MFLTLKNNDRGDYIYQRIYTELKDHILNENLKAHEKLPSKRSLANQLNVSVNSVTNAYEQLIAEGYIYTKQRRGYYVEDIIPFSSSRLINDNELPIDLKETTNGHEGRLSFSHMTADLSNFPFDKWLQCQGEALRNHKKELSEIPHFQGPFLVRESIAKMITISRGIKCEPEQIVIGSGTQPLIHTLMETQDNETVAAIEDPGYSRIYTLLKNMGFDVRTLNVDEKGASIKGINSDINFLFITPSHQFPTGKIMPVSRRIELLNWSIEKPNRYIVEDDYDSEFKYETDSIPSLQGLDRNQRVIYTGTFSKTILPGLRVSYMVLPPNLLREYRKHNQHLIQSGNLLTLYTLHYFIERGEYTRHLKKMNLIYERKRRKVIDELVKTFGQDVEIENIPAGLHFLVRIKTNLSYKQFEKKIDKEKLEVYSIRRFQLKKRKHKKDKIELVIGFANIKEDQIPEAVTRLSKALLKE